MLHTVMGTEGKSYIKGATWSPPSTPNLQQRQRRPVTNVRHEDKENKMTKLGNSGIHYSDDKIIGQGGTSIVYQGFYQDPIRKAAVKRVCNRNVDICKVELEIWQQITSCAVKKESVNVIQLYHWTRFRDGYYFAMEMAIGDLQKSLGEMFESRDPEWRPKVVGYLKDAAIGLSWLHSKRVIHRDIKPENILIFSSDDGSQAGRNIAKLADFGISKKISALNTTGTDTMAKGTLNWMPPEAIKAHKEGKNFSSTKALDIFSFGVTGHFAMTLGQHHPFQRSSKYGNFLQMNILCPDVSPAKIGNDEFTADHLFQWTMSQVPNGRPTIRQVLRHPFFWSVRKQLRFILDVAKALDNPKNAAIETVKANLDSDYRTKHLDFNWKDCLGSDLTKLLFQRKSSANSVSMERFDSSSVTTLIKLIRDKDVHHADLVDDLITPKYFGQQGENGEWVYCELKFIAYFCKKFPDLVIFLFVFLVKDVMASKVPSVKSVMWKYGLKEFSEKIPDVV